MAESQALMSIGITVTFTGITGELIDITKDGDTNDMADITHQQSDDKYREFKAGFTDPGTVTITANMIGAPAVDPQAKEDLTITIPTESGTLQMVCKASVATMASVDAPLGDKVSTEYSFKLSGKPTWSTAP